MALRQVNALLGHRADSDSEGLVPSECRLFPSVPWASRPGRLLTSVTVCSCQLCEALSQRLCQPWLHGPHVQVKTSGSPSPTKTDRTLAPRLHLEPFTLVPAGTQLLT